MLARLRTLWESLSTSLWFLPLLLVVAAVLLSWLAMTWSLSIPEQEERVWWLHSGTADNASDLLSSLLTSMITMATLAISITMVVLTLAAGQLGPRLIWLFMADKRTQLMLGFFIATIIYLVLVLRSIDNEMRTDEVPHLAVSIGSLMVLSSVLLLLLFVHHLARSIVADTIVSRVGEELDRAVEEFLPDDEEDEATSAERTAPGEDGAPIRLGPGGYVQAVDYEGLVRCAAQAGVFVDLRFRPGHHLLPDGEHARVHPASALSDHVQKSFADCVVMGNERTASQDLEFSIRRLVEIALRALSPGVNDPFTAVAVIDRLASSLALVMQHRPPKGVWCDEDAQPRVCGPTTTFSGLVDAAFNQIRQASSGQPAVLIRLLGTLGQLAEQASDEEQRRVLLQHVEATAATGKRNIEEQYDLDALEERRRRALARLQRP